MKPRHARLPRSPVRRWLIGEWDHRIQQQDSEKTICSDHEQKKNLSIVMVTELRTLIAIARHGTFSAAGVVKAL
ncbi:hypothetical protein [Pseudomonas fluorescens]|uniref:Uncharacterized protein n=1 Tax=Pseudomonas fluorescens TaxID=294 RepID=A0A944HFK2_PSEFL|nr:hypothetical protein [Pseudomonas fluorescens]MBT2294924.1 hypothetical protein [Pseudomonas fluorescens]MBT2309152.1 hypothetical protein [Pseudomonas fluorescens]MBT2313620.1 hypothetical protein [Pseudomonas fluorescens]MBT2318336.1 hypothetical protein [Pseudomonas fluorescens]MBT2328704.1 hypothetical protein [Pseudomonas fluorescens]